MLNFPEMYFGFFVGFSAGEFLIFFFGAGDRCSLNNSGFLLLILINIKLFFT